MAVAMVTRAQIRTIRSIAHGRLAWSDEEYHRWLAERGGPASTRRLTRAQAANVIDMLKALAFGRRLRVWHVDQATIRQQEEIDRRARWIRRPDQVPGIVRRVTRGRTNRPAQLTIWEARNVIDALESMTRRQRRQEARSVAVDPQPTHPL